MSFGYFMPGFGVSPAVSVYNPGMMTFDGSTGYYSSVGYTPVAAGNKETTIFRFNRGAFASGPYERIFNKRAGGSGYSRMVAYVIPQSAGTADQRGKLVISCSDSANVTKCRLASINAVDDGADHTVMASIDGDGGLQQFIIDGVDAIDSDNSLNVTVSAFTMPTGATSTMYVGTLDGTGNWFDGDIGYFGNREAYLTNHGDFMNGSNPRELDESGWTEWGAQPLFWNDEGTMTDNKGSGGNMTENGTITGPS